MVTQAIPQTGSTVGKSLSNIGKKAKSEHLTEAELQRLYVFRAKCKTDVQAACALCIDRNVLTRVLLVGSGSPETIAKIRKALNKKEALTK